MISDFPDRFHLPIRLASPHPPARPRTRRVTGRSDPASRWRRTRLPPTVELQPTASVNGNSRILNWRYCTICLAIFCGDILLHRPYIGLIYGRYLQSRILEWPLTQWHECFSNGSGHISLVIVTKLITMLFFDGCHYRLLVLIILRTFDQFSN